MSFINLGLTGEGRAQGNGTAWLDKRPPNESEGRCSPIRADWPNLHILSTTMISPCSPLHLPCPQTTCRSSEDTFFIKPVDVSTHQQFCTSHLTRCPYQFVRTDARYLSGVLGPQTVDSPCSPASAPINRRLARQSQFPATAH